MHGTRFKKTVTPSALDRLNLVGPSPRRHKLSKNDPFGVCKSFESSLKLPQRTGDDVPSNVQPCVLASLRKSDTLFRIHLGGFRLNGSFKSLPNLAENELQARRAAGVESGTGRHLAASNLGKPPTNRNYTETSYSITNLAVSGRTHHWRPWRPTSSRLTQRLSNLLPSPAIATTDTDWVLLNPPSPADVIDPMMTGCEWLNIAETFARLDYVRTHANGHSLRRYRCTDELSNGCLSCMSVCGSWDTSHLADPVSSAAPTGPDSLPDDSIFFDDTDNSNPDI